MLAAVLSELSEFQLSPLPPPCVLPYPPLLPPLQRFTKQGDTVMTLSAEADGVAEVALHYGRKFEGFVASEDSHMSVLTRLEDAWDNAWRMGKFPVSRIPLCVCLCEVTEKD